MGLISLALILGYYLYFTEQAGAFLVRYFLSKKIVAEEIEIEKISGTIFKGMVLKNVTIRNAEEISFPHIFRIQDLNIHFRFLRNPISLRIENARLFLADEDPIVFSGTYHNGEMDFNLYAWEMDFAPLVQWIGIKEIFFQKIVRAWCYIFYMHKPSFFDCMCIYIFNIYIINFTPIYFHNFNIII